MTILEVLEADWNVDRMEVTVRNQCGEFITAYIIGRDVKPSKYHRYQYETKAGSIYESQGCKYVFINRIIQHHQLDGKFREKAKSFGVLLEEIPKELLNLDIDSMRPYHMGCTYDCMMNREGSCLGGFYDKCGAQTDTCKEDPE